MSKHTAGPWMVHLGGIGVHVYSHGGAFGGGVQLARVNAVANAETQAANARLIAAAPDMLAALRGLLAGLPPFNPDHHPVLAGDVQKARAAIAKAEGEAA